MILEPLPSPKVCDPGNDNYTIPPVSYCCRL